MSTSAVVDFENRIRTVIARTFGLSPEQASSDLRMGSVPQWDSLGHMSLVMALEEEFRVTFRAYELAQLDSIATIASAIAAHGGR